MNATHELLDRILYEACANPTAEPDVLTFRIETHCVAWNITARACGDGHYDILNAVSEPC